MKSGIDMKKIQEQHMIHTFLQLWSFISNLGVFGKSTNKVRVHVYSLVVLDKSFTFVSSMSLAVHGHPCSHVSWCVCDKPLKLLHEKLSVSICMYVYIYIYKQHHMILLYI